MPSFESMKTGYANMWASAKVKRRATVEKVARGILVNRGKYEAVAHETGVPWEWIACVHHRESSGSFAGVLHNGQRIIGAGRKTTLVPKGRGPFETWEAAAIDALKLKGLHKIADWSIPRMLFQFEDYNGWGYFNYRKVNSPYVWAATSHQQPGKYVADGEWDATATDKQLGCAAILKVLYELEGVKEPPKPSTHAPKPAPAPSPDKPASLLSAFLRWLLDMLKRN